MTLRSRLLSGEIGRILAVRSDGAGDVLLTEPAVRALSGLAPVSYLVGPSGRAAAGLFECVDEVLEFDCPWIAADPAPVDDASIAALVSVVRRRAPDLAVIFTSPRQSPLPIALVLRLAGVPLIAAHSEHHPGSLLDVHLRADTDVHEVERNLELVAALGLDLPTDLRMRVRRAALPAGVDATALASAVVVHPGAAAPARTPDVTHWMDVVDALHTRGRAVVLTGTDSDVAARAVRSGVDVDIDLVGRTTLGELSAVLAGAAAVCVGNTGPMHLAAAAGTPVIALFPPTVPLERWRPWAVPHTVVAARPVPCAPCYQRHCAWVNHPCVDVDAARVAQAVEDLIAASTAQRWVSVS